MKKSTLVELPNSISHYKYYLLLIAIVLLVYGNSIANGYNMDDNLVTQNHPLTSQKSFSALYDIFTSPYYKDNMGNSYGYRPIVLLSFFLEHTIFGESPIISHFFNIFLYVIAVVLFFIFLVSLFGEKGLVLAMLSALFFAVHPIHAEVVDSIKNRDEILAFLFVTLSAVAIEKYLKTNTWISLISISIFFTLGMLSKKSIFPMMMVLPFIIGLFKEINTKQLISFSIALILPAAIIGSNLEIQRLILMFSIPLTSIYLIHYFKTGISIDKLFTKEVTIYFIPIISWFFVFMAIWKPTYGPALLTIPLLLFLIKKHTYWDFIQSFLQMLLIGLFLNLSDFLMIALIISIADYTYSLQNRKTLWKLLIVSGLTIFYFLFSNIDLSNKILIILDIIIFFYLTFRKASLGLLWAMLSVILNSIFFKLGLLDIILLTYSILYFINARKTSPNFLSNSIKIILVITSIYIFTPLNLFTQFGSVVPNNSMVQSSLPLNTFSAQNFMKEGRKLEYIENTLIAPHTLIETIGTGFITIGEYTRLVIFPKELSFYYGYAKIKTTGLKNLWVWVSIVFYMGLILLAIWQAKQRPIITIGVIWFVVSVLLFSNWPELVAGMVGERLAFTASAGFCIFVAGIVLWIKPNFSFNKPQVVEFVVFSILILFAARTIARNVDWKDPITLMEHDIKHLSNSAQANNLFAMFLMKEAAENDQMSPETKQNYRLKGIEHFKKAISIYPKFYNANFDLGRAYIDLGDFKNAKSAFLQSHKIDPENIVALEELTKTSFDLNQKDETEYYGNMYLEKDPNNQNIHELLAYIMLINNEKVKARIYSERGLKYFPDNQNLHHILMDSSK